MACTCNSCGSGCGEDQTLCTDEGLICDGGQCAECPPQCEGKQCGPDGCGGSCGACPGTAVCNETNGSCECDCPEDPAPVCDLATGTTYPNACEAQCHGIDQTTPGECDNCLQLCSPEEMEAKEYCGVDGITYANFCELKCNIGLPGCDQPSTCHQIAYPFACTDFCVVSEDEPADIGDPVPAFDCFDLNQNSPLFEQVVSDGTLKELVWIAYLGSCT